MEKSGLIRGFEPVIDPTATGQVLAFVKLRVPGKRVEKTAANLANLEEVKGVFVMAGSDNLTLVVIVDNRESLESFVEGKLAAHLGGEVVSREIATEVVKDVRGPNVKMGAVISLRCDYCHKDILSDRPYNIRARSTYNCFCSRACRKAFLDKHRSREPIIHFPRQGASPAPSGS